MIRLDPQLATFRDAQAAAVDQRGHQPGGPAHGPEQRGRLGHAEHDGEMDATFGSGGQRHALDLDAEDLSAQEQHGAERLILGARGDTLVNRQVRRVIAYIFHLRTRPAGWGTPWRSARYAKNRRTQSA